MATQFKVTYVDGTEAVVNRRPVHYVRVERLLLGLDRKFGTQEEVLAYIWAAATGGTGTIDDFDAWVDTVDDWQRAEVDDSPPAQGSGTSPD